MEDWDLTHQEKFQNLVTSQCISCIYYEDTEVTKLKPMKRVRGFQLAGLFHMLFVPQFYRSNINKVCVW